MSNLDVKITIINPTEYRDRGCRIPKYHSEGASGIDLSACIERDIKLKWGDRTLVPTGIKMEIPRGYEGQVRSRSGAAVAGLVVANAPGTIDSDYRGEILVLLTNIARTEFQDEDNGIWVRAGLRIAQIVIAPVAKANLVVVEQLSDTERGDKGFGSTGGMDLG